MIYELRTYTIKPTRLTEWLQLYKAEALEVQKEHLGGLIGFFTTEIGALNQVVHLWQFESLNDRESRRTKMGGDPRWQEFGRKNKDLDAIVQLESRVLRPTEFSPLN